MAQPLRVWTAFTGHGFGHFFQLMALLEALHARHPLTALLAGRLPRPPKPGDIPIPHAWDPRPRDVGLVQDDPMHHEGEATLTAYREFFNHWPARLEEERAAMVAWRPDLVVANIPCLTLVAGASLGIPTVALSSLTWDRVLEAYFPDHPPIRPWLARMRESYGRATLALHPRPTLPPGLFPRWEEIGPMARPGRKNPQRLRRELGLDSRDSRPIILVSMGGIQGRLPPMKQWDKGVIGLIDQAGDTTSDALIPLGELAHWRFSDLLASVDGVVGKPGYGMAVEAAAAGVPFLYVRRGIFPDEEPICTWMQTHNRAMEIPPEVYRNGDWATALHTLLVTPPPPPPRLDGAWTGAGKILELLGLHT